MLRAAVVGAEDPHATDEHRHLGSRQAHELRAIKHQLFGANDVVLLEPVAAVNVVNRLEGSEGLCVGHLVRGVTAARFEGHADLKARGLGRLLDADVACKDDDVRHARSGARSDPFEGAEDLGEALGLVALPILLRCESDPRPIRAPSHVRAAEGSCAVSGGRDHFADGETAGCDLHCRTARRVHFWCGRPLLPTHHESYHATGHPCIRDAGFELTGYAYLGYPPTETDCERQGGYCIPVVPGAACDDGYALDPDVACAGLGGQCCMPTTVERCGGRERIACASDKEICWYETGDEAYGACQPRLGDVPVCRAIGTRSEGWYWQDAGDLISYAFCAEEMAACYLTYDNRSQGFYVVGQSPSSESLITWDRCQRSESPEEPGDEPSNP